MNLSGAKTAAARATRTSSRTPDKTSRSITAVSPIVNVSAVGKMASLVRPEITRKIEPTILAINPELVVRMLEKTTTQLANGAIEQLKSVSREVRDEAINTVNSRNIPPGRLMSHLERRVKIGEVLNEMASQWEAETRVDFGEALNMDRSKRDVMDSIVSLAILNDPDLEDELRMEHMPDTSEEALLENRRIVWQHPPAGAPIDPPYLVYVAVEHQDMMEADDVVESILGQLRTHDGFKTPGTTASPRLRPSIGRTMVLKPRG